MKYEQWEHEFIERERDWERGQEPLTVWQVCGEALCCASAVFVICLLIWAERS